MAFEKRFVPHTPDGKPMWHFAAETEEMALRKLADSWAPASWDSLDDYYVKLLEVPHGPIS